MTTKNAINPTNDNARAIARDILLTTRFGALAVTLSDDTPYVARVAMLGDRGKLLTLISTLSTHTTAITANPACAALIGEPDDKGDPLNHPRMTLICNAKRVDKADYEELWLARIPKAKLYYNFTDFIMFELTPSEVYLNGGLPSTFTIK